MFDPETAIKITHKSIFVVSFVIKSMVLGVAIIDHNEV